MKKTTLIKKLIKINKGISILLEPESELNKFLERTNGMDLILSQDIHTLVQINLYLNEMEKTNYRELLLSKKGLKEYSPKERIKSGIEEIWKHKTKRIRKKIFLSKKKDQDLKKYVFRDFLFIDWILFSLVSFISFLPIGIFLILSIFLKELILIPGLMVSCYFFIWNILKYSRDILWR